MHDKPQTHAWKGLRSDTCCVHGYVDRPERARLPQQRLGQELEPAVPGRGDLSGETDILRRSPQSGGLCQ